MRSESVVGSVGMRRLCHRCQTAGVVFFFNQWNGRYPKRLGRELDGVVWDEYPDELRGGGSDGRRGIRDADSHTRDAIGDAAMRVTKVKLQDVRVGGEPAS